MEVSIIIVNYNAKTYLRDCLRSIYEKTKFLSFEILVIDNASTDGSLEMIKAHFPKVTVIESEINLGFGQANNKAALSAQGKYLFFLNPDTQLINNAIYIMHRFISRHSEASICGGNLYNSTLKPAVSFSRNMPGLRSDLDYFFGNLFARIKYGRSLHFNYKNQPLKIDGFISGANLMVHKNVFWEGKGFDPSFFLYYEETELTYRLKNTNHQVFSVPRAKIMHLEGALESINKKAEFGKKDTESIERDKVSIKKSRISIENDLESVKTDESVATDLELIKKETLTIKKNTVLRNYQSKYTYYQKTNQGNIIYISHLLFILTAWQRIGLFSLVGKKSKVHTWLNLLKWEKEAYSKFNNKPYS